MFNWKKNKCMKTITVGHCVGHTEYFRDSFEFKKKISNIPIPNNYTIISLDTVSYVNYSSKELIVSNSFHTFVLLSVKHILILLIYYRLQFSSF